MRRGYYNIYANVYLYFRYTVGFLIAGGCEDASFCGGFCSAGIKGSDAAEDEDCAARSAACCKSHLS